MQKIQQQSTYPIYLFLLCLYVLTIILYVYGRFGLNWLNGDAIQLTRLSQNVFLEGQITPSQGAYPFGFAYPALNTILSHLTGVTVHTTQTYLQPFLVLILVPIGYIAFYRLITIQAAALLAVLLLFLQPEFLFEVLRSTHGKFTWSLTLLLLFLLARSLQSRVEGRGEAASVLAFYLTAFALITNNAYFASNYIFGIAFVFVSVHVLKYVMRDRHSLIQQQMGQLWLVVFSCLILAFVFVFYLYPPALSIFNTLESVVDKVATLFLEVEETNTVNPYAYVSRTWVSQPIYLAVSAANWLTLAFSLLMWLLLGWRYLIQRQLLAPPLLLLWLLYVSFAFLLTIAVLIDFAGALSANLQVRLFPHLMIAGIPLAALLLHHWLIRSRNLSQPWQFAFTTFLPMLLILLTVAGLVKVTNEPLFSNWWAFHTPGEKQIVVWSGHHLQNSIVWSGGDYRLLTVAAKYADWTTQQVYGEVNRFLEGSRYIIVSPVMEAYAIRIQSSLPDTRYHQQVYDNGQAQLYQRRPQTPFQR